MSRLLRLIGSLDEVEAASAEALAFLDAGDPAEHGDRIRLAEYFEAVLISRSGRDAAHARLLKILPNAQDVDMAIDAATRSRDWKAPPVSRP